MTASRRFIAFFSASLLAPTCAFAHGEEVIFVIGGHALALLMIFIAAFLLRLRLVERVLFVLLPVLVTAVSALLPNPQFFIITHFGRVHAIPFFLAGLLPPSVVAAIVYGLRRRPSTDS